MRAKAVPDIPLPKGWARLVRSAVIHTISLAQTSLTHARSVTANSVNARIRLKEESECTRRLVAVPFRREAFEEELSIWLAWHNTHRPHETLGARTPDEVYFGRRPACRSPRFEPRTRWPRGARCTGPHALIRGRPGVRVDLDVSYLEGRAHLPLMTLRRAA